jgi:hypothetical protein
MNNGNNSIFRPDGKNAIHDGIEHEPGGGKALLDPTDTLFLLLDHQSGLFQNVKDISVADLRANTTALAKLAALCQIPVITTASVPEGPNGPLMPEIHEAAPHAVYVPRKGEVNAWDNALFVKTVRETGKKTLVIAGVWTSVCVMFPALDAKAAGFKVYAVMDASGDPSHERSPGVALGCRIIALSARPQRGPPQLPAPPTAVCKQRLPPRSGRKAGHRPAPDGSKFFLPGP